MAIYTGDFKGPKIFLTPKLSSAHTVHLNSMELFK